MKELDAINLVKKTIVEIFDEDIKFTINESTPLIGSKSNLDSMKLVE